MDINEALEKASRILEEEQVQPSLGYRYVSYVWPSNQRFETQQQHWTPAMAAQRGLAIERKQRPRDVYEDPKLYVFESVNFSLLVKILSQVGDADRANFVSTLLNCVRTPIAARPQGPQTHFPCFLGKTSALALLAEFCVRTGHLKELLAATAEVKKPATGIAVMLMEIEEMIALNFNLFSDNELTSLPSSIAQTRLMAERQTWKERRPRGGGGPTETNPYYRSGSEEIGREIVAAIDGIMEECRKARFWYLKGALQELPNLEIESDKLKVEGFLVKLGFSDDMVRALNAAESDYKSTATAFELKNCLSHLRSFLEYLHREAAKSISAAAGEVVNDRWGDAINYLRQKQYFTKQHESFVASLYTLVSDESVHPLTADREYARLLRNVVIEYGVMFLTVLDKRGVKI